MITKIKSSIGYANICSSVQDHRLKFICLKIKYWFSKKKLEQKNFQEKPSCKSESKGLSSFKYKKEL